MTKKEFETLAYSHISSISQTANTRERALNEVVNLYATGVNPWDNAPEEIANQILCFSQYVVGNHNSMVYDNAFKWSIPKRLEPYQIALILKYQYGKDILDYDKQALRKLVWQYDIRCFNVERIKDYVQFYLGENDV